MGKSKTAMETSKLNVAAANEIVRGGMHSPAICNIENIKKNQKKKEMQS